MTTVLVVDDDIQILRALRINLAARGYSVLTAADGATALRAAADCHPDAIVLDLELPDMSGSEVIARIRERTAVPIIVLSARTGSADKVRAMDQGADDYVTKPFGVDELCARLRAAVRRAASAAVNEPRIEAGELTIDLAAKIVERSGVEVRLTAIEWWILELLVRHRGELVSHSRLFQEVWGAGERKAAGHLRVYLAQLRRKLEPEPSRPRHLITEADRGYRFRA
jgi:two-component system, OmpR family, KDP operon response regulator KdpE